MFLSGSKAALPLASAAHVSINNSRKTPKAIVGKVVFGMYKVVLLEKVINIAGAREEEASRLIVYFQQLHF